MSADTDSLVAQARAMAGLPYAAAKQWAALADALEAAEAQRGAAILGRDAWRRAAEAAEAQRDEALAQRDREHEFARKLMFEDDALVKAARLVIARRDSLSVYDVEHALDALAAALAGVAPPEMKP